MANTLSPTDNMNFTGKVTFQKPPSFPAASVPDAAIAGPLSALNLTITHASKLSQTGTIVAATQYVGIIDSVPCTLAEFEAAITETIATGADRTVTVDLQRSTGGGAFASVLSAPIVFTNVSTLRAVVQAGLTTTTWLAGDLIKITVAVAGAAGNQALGLVVMCKYYEAPL